MKVCILGALDGTVFEDSLKKFYEDIVGLLSSMNTESCLFDQHPDSEKYLNLTPKSVYQIISDQVVRSSLVIAHVRTVSHDVGMGIEIANSVHIPVVLIHEPGAGISRMLLGNPAVITEIVFVDYRDALCQLRMFLHEYLINHPN